MDLRVERTKRNIKDAFMKLREKKALEKITVKELAELAYINKATFYLHYNDIYDLSEQLEDEVITSIIDNTPTPENLLFSARENVRELAEAMWAQKEVLNVLFSGSREAVLENKIEKCISKKICMAYPMLENDLPGKIVLTMLIRGGFYIFSTYSDEYDVDEIMQKIGDINECLVKNFIKV